MVGRSTPFAAGFVDLFFVAAAGLIDFGFFSTLFFPPD
jgi:hypothetical protein